MKNLLFLLLTTLVLTSCSTDSDSNDNSFFNLNEGNLWVYRRYVSTDNVNYTPTNRIDSLRVTGDTLISNLHYAKLVHKIYNSNVQSEIIKECLRVDSNGHLVNQNGLIYHPGTDSEYYNIRSVSVGPENTLVGSLAEQLIEPFTTTIEGVDYFVYCYYGIFSPNDPALQQNYIFYQYKEGLGTVNQRCVSIAGPTSTEDRLIYYEVN